MTPPGGNPWAPRGVCTTRCVGEPTVRARPGIVALRLMLVVLVIPVLPLLALPIPGRRGFQRRCCRLVLRCFGVRVATTGGPLRNLRGMLVVSPHVSWLDVFVVGAVLPGTFVARADLVSWPGIGTLVRMMRIIPIDRASLRSLPGVVASVADRLRAGRTVVAFPEGTTWCGRTHGRFYPALFQGAVDAARPVQPLQLSYRRPDGSPSTLPAFVGDDTLGASMRRLITARRTLAQVHLADLQLPGADRRDLAVRCQAAVGARVARPESTCIPC